MKSFKVIYSNDSTAVINFDWRWRGALLLCAMVCFFFSLGPYFMYKIVNEGSMCVLLLAVFLFVCVCVYPHRRSCGARVAVWTLLKRILQIFLVCELALSSIMLFNIFTRPAVYDGRTVVVLGCKTIDGRPSEMLEGRLKSALEYLRRSPDSSAVVTGYVSTGDVFSQAEVMKRWLVENGIAESRIFMEDRAIDTHTNMKNTSAIIQAENLPKNIAVATDAFHIPRAMLYANMYGMHGAVALPSMTDLLLLPIYWVREQLGIVEALIF